MGGPVQSALLLADARFPTGAHAYSAGLEPAIIGGLTTADVYPYMLARLCTVVHLDAAACVLSHRLAVADGTAAAYACLESAMDARTPSAAQREASRALGRALLRLAQSLRPDHYAVMTLGALNRPPMRAVALGVIGAALGVDERHCAEVCCYEELQSIASAALKLLPTDPVTVTRWVVDAADRVAQVVDGARAVQDCADLPAFSAPWMEHWAEAHARRTRRLFVA